MLTFVGDNNQDSFNTTGDESDDRGGSSRSVTAKDNDASGSRMAVAVVATSARPNKCVLLLLIILSLGLVTGQLYEGSSCRTKNGTLGICKVHRHCVWAMNGYRERTFTIVDMVRCGFSGRDEVICCLDETPDQATTESNDQYVFIDGDGTPVTTTTQRVITSVPLVTPPPTVGPRVPDGRRKSETECERFVREYSVLTYHILGGEATNLGDFPHMAALGYPSDDEENAQEISWRCGGSLVSENFILTAAHCLTRAQPTVARLGQVSLATMTPEAQDVGIAEVIMHPEYIPSRNYHDIALLRLASSVNMTENVYPACLRTSVADVPNESLIVTGWGDTSVERRERSNILLKTNLTAVDLTSCNQSYAEQPRNRRLPTLLNQGQLCASDPRGVNDACQGDSGGPLQIIQPNNFGLVVGITSFGTACGSLVPSVYARVAFYIDWLESVIWPN